MEREERELFAKGVGDAVARGGGATLDAALAGLGWADALASDEQTAVSVLFEAQGRAAASSGALDLVLCRALGCPPAPVVLPAFGSISPPAVQQRDGTVAVRGLASAAIQGAAEVRVPCGLDGQVGGLDVDPSTLSIRAVGGLDPTLGLAEVAATLDPPHEFWPGTVGAGPHEVGPELVGWVGAVAAGQRAIAHELVGASAAMLDLARDHALERVQFGVPIASFQAVRHKLADTYVALESARTALDAAWEEGRPFDAMMAKAIAGRSARVAAKHCQQVLAGIGFTLEHPLHRYLRRVRVLDGLLGDTRSLTRWLGEQLLSDRRLPEILPLRA